MWYPNQMKTEIIYFDLINDMYIIELYIYD